MFSVYQLYIMVEPIVSKTKRNGPIIANPEHKCANRPNIYRPSSSKLRSKHSDVIFMHQLCQLFELFPFLKRACMTY